MKTLQEQYNQIKEGKGHKGVFMNDAKRLFPQFITNTISFDQVTTILKQKSIINEDINIKGLGIVANLTKPDWHKIFEEKLNSNSYDNTDKNKIDNLNGDEFQKGIYIEMGKIKSTINDQNLGELLNKAKETVTKNLVKNPLFYIENSAFNVENLGYSKDRPGLTPTEIKGKLKGSGYGESSKSKPKQGEPGTGFIPVKESKISYKDLLNS